VYLKQLEIQGFKTFADRTQIVFTPGITCVIGPNGSGKSNIADALLWVLGESNVRELRGNTAQDVIFAGNDRRRPQGMAEVSLTIDNSQAVLPLEFSEITVTRRVYRSGESEFQINKVACRLRDIYELFLDTGVGRDAYAMINQGQVDQILSVRAEDRRAIFEEAAGIKKYRVRKREAERKLENTRQNLLRVTDILVEIEARLAPLQRQAAAAGRYRDLASALRALETAWYGQRIRRLRTERLGLVELVEAMREERSRLEAELRAAQDAEAAHREAMRAAEERGEALRRDETAALQRIAGAEAERARAEERAGEVERRLKAIDRELEDLATRTEEQLRRREQNSAEEAARRTALEEVRAALTLAQREAAARAQAHEEALGALEARRQAWVARERREAELTAREEALAQRAAALAAETARAAAAVTEAAAECDRLAGEQAALEARAAALAAGQAETSVALDAAREGVATAETRLGAARTAAAAAGRDLQSHRARLQALKDLGERAEGAAAGARGALAEAREGRLPGTWLLFAETLAVPAGLEAAVEAALGPYADALWCETPEAALAGLEWARGAGCGLIVLPGDAPAGPPTSADSLGARVHAEGPAAGWARFLLGPAVVVDRLTDGAALQVTKEGHWRTPAGALAWRGAGGEGSAAAILARRREIEALEGELPRLEAAAGAAAEAAETAETAAIAARQALQSCEGAAGAAHLEQQTARREAERLGGDLDRARRRAEQATAQAARAGQERQAVAAAREAVAADLAALEAPGATAEEGEPLRAAREAAAAAERERRLAGEAATELRVRLAEEEQRFQAAVEATRRAVDAGAFLDRQRTERLREQRTLTAERDQRRLTFGGLAQEAQEAEAAAREAREAQEALARERAELAARLAAARGQGTDLTGRLRELMERCHRAEVELAAVEAQLKHTGQQWLDATVSAHTMEAVEQEEADEPLDFTVDALMAAWDPDEAEAALGAHSDAEGEIARLRRQIRALGAINPDAPEQYAEARERYDFLSTQKADLESAREQLEEAIREIDVASRDTFLAAFREIAAAFDDTFKQLFGGGTTELRLTDPQDVLETGIDIIVQPPGKKQQNLLLLSGGERALTAAAMLFALLRVRPSPFCVLDEVDAPLDEHNVGRFSRMLRDFAGKTQFIVVTHNRGTMEEADTLYGVTMEERGVSKVLSCTLADPVVAQVAAEAAAQT